MTNDNIHGDLVIMGGPGESPAADAFADEFVNGETFGDSASAARAAGLGVIENARVARRVASRPEHQAAMRRAIIDRLMGYSSVLVVRTLEGVMLDSGAAPADRVKAAAALGRMIADVAATKPDEAPRNSGQAAMPDSDKIKAVAMALAAALKNETGA